MYRLLPILVLTLAATAQDPLFLDRAEGLPSDDVLDLCASGPDRVWAATSAGLCLIERHGLRRIGPEGAPRQLEPAADGGVYALYPDRIARVDEQEVEWIDLPFDPARVTAVQMTQLGDAGFHLVTPDASYRLAEAGTWAPDSPLRWSAQDPKGGVARVRDWTWVATRGRGIQRVRRRPRFLRFEIPGAQNVNAIAEAPDGAIWCGTESGVALVRGSAVEVFDEIDGKALSAVTACAVDRAGRVWIGSGSSFTGLYRLDAEGWRHLDAIEGHVHRISVDPTGTLWFAVLQPEGGEPGAWYFSEGEFRRAAAFDALPSARVYDVVARDPAGVLWFATLKGLAASDGKGKLTHYTPSKGGLRGEKVWCLCAARDGSLWIGYQAERGASRLARGEIEHFDVEDGLCDGNVWSIVEGPSTVFWFATRHGLSRFDGRRWSCFRNEEGLPDAPLWPLLPARNGTLWIGTLGGGLVHLTPGDDEPPRTRFAADRFDSPIVSWTGTDAWFDTPRDRIWYRWRVGEGRWSPASSRTSVELELPPGDYRLEVQSIDRFGNVEDPPAAVDVHIPAATMSTWPWIAGAVVLLLAGFAIGRRQTRSRRDS